MYDVRLATGASSASHLHAVPTVAVLVTGSAASVQSETREVVNAAGQWLLIEPGQPHVIEAAQSDGVHLVEVEVR